MSLDQIPQEPLEPEQQPDQGSAGARPLHRRRAAIIAACAILALPIGYLVVHYGLSEPVSANARPAAAPAQSIASLEELVRVNPTVGNRINLSLAYINGNQAVRAIPILDAIVAEDGNNTIAWNNLCVAHTLQMEYNIALEDCNHAIRIAPDFQLARNNLKWAQDDNQKAIVAINAQEQIAPATRDANSYLAEGLNFLHIGNYDQAIKAWQRALDLNPRNALAANNIGIAYMFKKEPGLAIAWFEKAIVFDPALQIAKNNLAWAEDEQAKSAK
jgi:tetratricopeptide (TPR) repeat protein